MDSGVRRKEVLMSVHTLWRHSTDDLDVRPPWNFIENIFADRGGVVDAMLLEPTPTTGNRRILWRVARGQSFAPEHHNFPHLLWVMRGSGVMCVAGVRLPYAAPKTSFMVEAGVMHHILAVAEETIVLQVQP